MSKDQARGVIEKLVERFAEHLKSYHSPDYNEAKTRQDFINPFFKALGWDVDNENGISEAYREVIYEDKVVVRGKAKAPDYGFRLLGQGKKRLFYVEAKKPSVALKANKEASYQLRRYGSSAQAPISILTNFEDFIVYDCAKVPNLNDSASVARIKHISFEDYIKEFDFIYDTFSHEAVVKGRFDKFVQSDVNKKGRQTLDKEFVQSLDAWRKYLAISIAFNNKKISDEELNFCVQLIIDRLIFLRFCEDRSIEPYGQLQKAASKGEVYKNLFDLFRQADDKYNSGLFDFEKDHLTSGLKIDNKVVRNIVEDLYYPQCRYEFSVMPVEVLGNAYEQFLGKVIRITPARGVKIEEKPEVRKAGGVYYTPQYIVEYIVKNTVGKLIEGKAPKEIEKIKIVDPACGSGSFLVGAFEYLLNYHIDWYHRKLSDKEKKKSDLITPDGKLTTHEKKRILINNIYGVDLDANAVEVSKLSLLLKCMEGETEASIKQQVTMFHERVLPDLDNNIKDGNSLIDTDFYDTQIDFGYERKIKPFSWKRGFPEIHKQGGFDAVIGNPPYDVLEKERLGNAIPHAALQEYIKVNNSYHPALGGKLNLYRFFVIKFIQLTKINGRYGLIIPSSILGDTSCSITREHIISHTANLEFDCFPQKDNPAKRVFYDAKLSTTILFGNKSDLIPEKERRLIVRTYPANSFADQYKICEINFIDLRKIDDKNLPIPLIDKRDWNVLLKLHSSGNIVPLVSLESDFIVRRGEINQTIYKSFIQKNSAGAERLIKGVQIGQYRFKTKLSQGEVEWFNEKQFLKTNNPKDLADLERIATQRITGVDERLRLVASIIQPKAYFADSTNSIHGKKGSKYNLKYLLALFNSRLFQWRFKLTSTNNNVGTNELNALPIRTINFKDKIDNNLYNELIKQSELLIQLNSDLVMEKLPAKISQISNRIGHGEETINQLVYKLYELTPEEIKIVEGGSNE
jgi:Alw26I/Eco31I/Esp3I family type II restriction m6 adenine DNA methyltransferase